MFFLIRRLALCLLAALPAGPRMFACRVMFGHDLAFDNADQWLRLTCPLCSYRTPGLDTLAAPPTIKQQGDPRASAMTSRRALQQPEPLDPVWYESEHFQGDHARAN